MKAALFILCVVPLALTQSDRCVTRKVDDGKCRLLIDCPALSEMAEVLSNSTFAKDYGGCGTDENENLMVCCPVNATTDRCVTRRVDDGKCRPYMDCPALSEMAAVLSISNFVKEYGGCGKDENENLMVCCPVNTTTVIADATCKPPGVIIPELGCIIHVPTSMTWYRAQTNCLKMNGQLVEGFTKEHQSIMYENFKHQLRADPFVGVRQGRWALSKEPVPNELWGDGYGGPRNRTDLDCGLSVRSMKEYCCDCDQASICQIKL
ncbi:uncharacterized protein [Palaemon carinicauda]|uniref:uncharacterized protein isoform X1 n=1 Tax=Palaemon carinicauda TaxID=392227 RepID=UPI0035B6566C